jgi:MSHA biogenesis protein MshQ
LCQTLLVVGLLLSNLVQAATNYTFSSNGDTLPIGCSLIDAGARSYGCSALELVAGDTIALGGVTPVTITFSGTFTTGTGNLINAGKPSEDLTLITNAAFVLGANSIMNANVVGVGTVNLASESRLSGNISTSASTGVITLEYKSRVGGDVSTQAGGINLGVRSTVDGEVSSTDGVVTLLTDVVLGGGIATTAGGITIGDRSWLCGSVVSTGAGVVGLTNNVTVGGSVSTGSGAINIGTGSTVGKDIISGGVTTLNGVLVKGSVISSAAGAINAINTSIGNNARSQAGVITLDVSRVKGTVLSDVDIVSTASIIGDTDMLITVPTGCTAAD